MRDGLVTYLREQDIGCEVYYPVPMHLQRCFSYLGYGQGDFPEAERASNEVIALPVYPELTNEMKDCVVEHVLRFVSQSQ